MILTHESGSQEDQFDEKKWRQKISWDYPFKVIREVIRQPIQDIAVYLCFFLNMYENMSLKKETFSKIVTLSSQSTHISWKVSFKLSVTRDSKFSFFLIYLATLSASVA